MFTRSFAIALVLITLLPRLPRSAAEERWSDTAGAATEKLLNVETLSEIDAAVADAIARRQFLGAVVLVSRKGQVAWKRAYGTKVVNESLNLMTQDTIFDMASITKVVATATSVMILVDQGRIEITDPVAKYIPEFAQNGKTEVTIEQLLRHRGGFIPDNALADYQDGRKVAFERIWELAPIYEPGSKFRYTDVGFIVLGELVHRVSGMTLDAFAEKHIFKPLGMDDSSFGVTGDKRERTAPTEKRDGDWMLGTVHDPRAYLLGGVAGHAGLFSTADDLARYAHCISNGGSLGKATVLSQPTVAKMTSAADTPAKQRRGLGWDVDTGYSSPRGKLLPVGGFGHTGFTGTSLWIDPKTETVIIILTSRVHPVGRGNAIPIRRKIADIVARALPDGILELPADLPRQEYAQVLCGIDVLASRGFDQLQGKRVGLITNHTGVDRLGNSTIDLLHQAPKVRLVRLFSPEHGIRGEYDAAVGDAVDRKTGLPILSLYGDRRKPAQEQLDELDCLVFDIQDIGCRFYTYAATMCMAMEAAAEKGIQFFVLDRPNPIGGAAVEGPVLDPGSESFVGYHTIPVRHGLTLGEYARLFQKEKELDLNLEVVAVSGWKRSQMLDQTGLFWKSPSPNMRSLRQALLYPGIGLLETTNLSVGRGTDTPFEIIGAPYIQARALAIALREEELPGVVFVPRRFSPESSTWSGTDCKGVEIIVTDRASFRPIATGLAIARQLVRLYPSQWKTERYNRLLSDKATLQAVKAAKPLAEIIEIHEAELSDYLQRRQSILMYK